MYIAGYKNIIRNIYIQALCTLYQQTNSMHALVLQKILDSSCFSVSSYWYLRKKDLSTTGEVIHLNITRRDMRLLCNITFSCLIALTDAYRYIISLDKYPSKEHRNQANKNKSKFHQTPGFIVLVSQNLRYFSLYNLTTVFMVILFHKNPSLSRNSYEYDK
jgi:hypothetical protein